MKTTGRPNDKSASLFSDSPSVLHKYATLLNSVLSSINVVQFHVGQTCARIKNPSRPTCTGVLKSCSCRRSMLTCIVGSVMYAVSPCPAPAPSFRYAGSVSYRQHHEHVLQQSRVISPFVLSAFRSKLQNAVNSIVLRRGWKLQAHLILYVSLCHCCCTIR